MDNLFGPSEDQSENQYPDIQKLIFNEISSSQTLLPSTLASNTANNLLWEYFLNRKETSLNFNFYNSSTNNITATTTTSNNSPSNPHHTTTTTTAITTSTTNGLMSDSLDKLKDDLLLNSTNLTNPNDQMTKLSQSDLIHNYIKKIQSFGNDLNCVNNDNFNQSKHFASNITINNNTTYNNGDNC
ncbi:unnamed protein product [Schistosoma mattheei]|uniref:Uncharacterized protein n=1 Tax=Schistosoma mattheei TaxID=31246 RepID=A0A183PX49_9TREM|nr:unnamed protein product [Schistosoma mattheei]